MYYTFVACVSSTLAEGVSSAKDWLSAESLTGPVCNHNIRPRSERNERRESRKRVKYLNLS